MEMEWRYTDEPWPNLPAGSEVRTGDFRVARTPDGSRARIVLVTEVIQDDGEPYANVMLVASVDEATPEDVLLYRSETDLPFDVLVETDIQGCAYLSQFGPLLGRLQVPIPEVVSGMPERRGISQGTWKERELLDMHAISYRCFTDGVHGG